MKKIEFLYKCPLCNAGRTNETPLYHIYFGQTLLPDVLTSPELVQFRQIASHEAAILHYRDHHFMQNPFYTN